MEYGLLRMLCGILFIVEIYDEKEYIRNYDEFLNSAGGK